ncbi:MAG TPA: hypothetical protein VMW38_16485, partial [Terriglobia bacterium]|nr:hypothetical protein [Terriglobia bacterium]
VAVVLISPLGGPERVLTELTSAGTFTVPYLSWSPDGRALAMVDQTTPGSNSHLVLYMMDTGEKQVLTKTSPNIFPMDSCPAFSPDGHTLAFRRMVAWASDLYLLDLSPDLKPVGEPRRLTFQSSSGLRSGVAWVPDGSALVYSAGGNLWRVAASGTSQPLKLSSAGQDAYEPAISRRGFRLAYTHAISDVNIWRIEISSPQGKANPPTKFIASTRFDAYAQYSPDGKKIAFCSDRSGSLEIWVCDADGANAIPLTHFGKGYAELPQWSPDSRRLTFYSNVEGHTEVYVINASGGNPRRLTFSSLSENSSWSRDGRWIYFNDLEGMKKVPPEGGPVVLVKKLPPGYAPIESADGKSIFFTDRGTDASNEGVWRIPVEGGESEQVLDDVTYWLSYLVWDDGIYFVPRPGPATGGYSLRFFEFATRKTKTIAVLGCQFHFCLSVSPDRRWALYDQIDQSGGDLMLVENFK